MKNLQRRCMELVTYRTSDGCNKELQSGPLQRGLTVALIDIQYHFEMDTPFTVHADDQNFKQREDSHGPGNIADPSDKAKVKIGINVS